MTTIASDIWYNLKPFSSITMHHLLYHLYEHVANNTYSLCKYFFKKTCGIVAFMTTDEKQI